MSHHRLHIPTRRRSRVTAIGCRLCGQWRKPRHIRVPAMICRDCETTPAFQAWKPTTRVTAATPGPDNHRDVPAGTHRPVPAITAAAPAGPVHVHPITTGGTTSGH